MTQVSVVIPAHNASSTLGLCLSALAAQTAPAHEIIVVDDGSTDDTATVARQFEAQYVHTERQGPAAARNTGAKKASGNVVAFTDSDCIPEREWIAKIAEAFADGPTAVGGSYAIANSSALLARLIQEEIADRHRRMQEDADFLGSFNVAYDRQRFLDAGGFSEEYQQASGEDNDLAYRLHDSGAKLRFVPTLRVAHHHPERLGRYLRTQARHGFWRVKLYRDHRGRTGGDQYAGIFDMLGPPTALVLLAASALLAALAIGGTVPPYGPQVQISLCALYALVRAALPLRVLLRTANPETLLLWPLIMIRDVARGMGMVHGFLYFFLKRDAAK